MASQKTPAPTKPPYEKGKHAVGPEAFRQMQNSRLLLERTLQGARELDEGKGIPWADFVKECDAREREAEERAAG